MVPLLRKGLLVHSLKEIFIQVNSDFVCTLFSLTESPTIAFQVAGRPAERRGFFIPFAQRVTALEPHALTV